MKSFILIIAFLLGNLHFASAKKLGQEGHGGDVVVGMFLGIAQATLNCMKENSGTWKEFPNLLEDLSYVFEHTQVSSRTEPVYLNGLEIDAINYPDSQVPRIIVSRGRWLADGYPNSYRAFLVLHEYLSIAGYNIFPSDSKKLRLY